MRMPITPHKADPPTSDLYEPLTLFHRFPQFFRIPPLPQTLSLRQLEPHCVNPATSIRITNKLSLKTINHRATILFDSSSPSSTRLPRPRAALRPLLFGSPRSLPTRLGSRHSHVGDEKQPLLTSSKTSLCTLTLDRDARNPFRMCFYEDCRVSPAPGSHFSLFTQRVFHNSFAIKQFRTLSKNCRVYSSASRFETRLFHPFAAEPGASISLVTYVLTPLLPSRLFSKSFSCNTYESPRKCCKQKTYGPAKPFRCNTYKKHGGGVQLLLTRNTKTRLYPAGVRYGGRLRALSFHYFLTSLPRHFIPRSAFHPIHRDPAHQLGIKVRRLLRHHFPGRRDLHHLLDVAGIQQKRNLRASAVHGIERRRGFPFISQVCLRRHCLRGNSQRRLHDSFVQQHHVQFRLQRRNISQELCQVDT